MTPEDRKIIDAIETVAINEFQKRGRWVNFYVHPNFYLAYVKALAAERRLANTVMVPGQTVAGIESTIPGVVLVPSNTITNPQLVTVIEEPVKKATKPRKRKVAAKRRGRN